MVRLQRCPAWFHARYKWLFIASAALTIGAHAADAQLEEPVVTESTSPIVGVRTHWEVRLMEPEWKIGTPQFIAVITPDGSLNNDFAILELNHSTIPEATAGGIQFQVWHGDLPVKWYSPGSNIACQYAGETIRFTMEMKLEKADSGGQQIVFSVINLASSTWGKIGTVATFTRPTQLTSLNGFTPHSSVKESGVSVGGNRVEYMKIDSIDYLAADGTRTSNSTDHLVHSAKQLVETQLDAATIDKVLAY